MGHLEHLLCDRHCTGLWVWSVEQDKALPLWNLYSRQRDGQETSKPMTELLLTPVCFVAYSKTKSWVGVCIFNKINEKDKCVPGVPVELNGNTELSSTSLFSLLPTRPPTSPPSWRWDCSLLPARSPAPRSWLLRVFSPGLLRSKVFLFQVPSRAGSRARRRRLWFRFCA